MKTTHIFLFAFIAVCIAIIVSTTGSAGEYVDFGRANQAAKGGDETKYHVIGELTKDGQGHILGQHYQPEVDPNLFQFTLKDQKGLVQQVVYYNPKPQDFDRSEKVVVIGKSESGVFVADKILMKCPSKYQNQEFNEATL